jgi:hypothetical protein
MTQERYRIIELVTTRVVEPLREFMSPRRSSGASHREEMLQISRRLSDEISRRPTYNAAELHARFVTPLLDPQEEEAARKRRPALRPAP